MVPENKKKALSLGKACGKLIRYVSVVFIIIVLLVFLLLPVFISSSTGRKAILSRINNSVDGRADFAKLSMGWLKGIKVTDISFTDNAGCIMVDVKQIFTKPHYTSILTGGLSLGETVIDEPKVEIRLQDKQRRQNKNVSEKTSSDTKPQAIALPIKKADLVINNGSVKVTDQKSQTVELSRINTRLNLRPPGQETKFNVALALVDRNRESKIDVSGQLKPSKKAGWTLKGTTGSLTIDTDDLDIESLGTFLALAGIEIEAKGNISTHITAAIKDGGFEHLQGTIKGSNLDITGPALKGDSLKTSVMNIDIELKQEKEAVDIKKLDIQTDWLQADISGIVPTTNESFAELLRPGSDYKLSADFDCNVAAVLSQMPEMLSVKEGLKITAGRLSGDVETFGKAGKRQILGQVNLLGLKGIFEGKQIALSQPVEVAVKINSDKDGIKYDKLDVTSSFCKISCKGTNKLLNYNAAVDLQKLQGELGHFVDWGPYKIAGQFTGKGRIFTTKNKINADGDSVLQNLKLTSKKGISAAEPKVELGFAFGIDRGKRILDVEFAKVDADFGRFNVTEAIVPLDKETKTPIKMEIIAGVVDLAKLQPFAILFGVLPDKMQLSGIVNSKLSLSSQKNSYRIATEATKVKNLKIAYPGKVPFKQDEVSVIFDTQINSSEKTININKFQLISPQIKIRKGQLSQAVKGNQTSLKGRFDLEYDWQTVGALVSQFMPEGLELKGKRKDTISFNSKYPKGQNDKLLANLNTKANLGFEKADYMGLNFGPTDVDIEVKQGLLKIAPFSTTVNNGKLAFAATADFKNKPVLLKIPKAIQMVKDIQINRETTQKLLKYINPVFANTVDVNGVLNFNCEELAIPLGQADQDDIKVVGTISISRMHLQSSDLLGKIFSAMGANFGGEEITIHPTRFVLKEGFLKYDNMQMDIGNNPVNFGGTIGLDKTLDMKVTLPYTTAGRTVRVGEESGAKRMVLSLGGTVDDPQLDVGKLLEDQIKDVLQQELQKRLGDLFK